MTNMDRPTATQLLEMAKAGATIDIVAMSPVTMTRVTRARIDAAVVARFEKVNRPVLKESSDGRLLMSSGSKYLDCSHNTIRITDSTGSRTISIWKL